MKDENKDEIVKENFCTSCLAIVPGLIGAGGVVGSSGKGGKDRKMRNIVFWSSIALIILSIIIYIYFKRRCVDCR